MLRQSDKPSVYSLFSNQTIPLTFAVKEVEVLKFNFAFFFSLLHFPWLPQYSLHIPSWICNYSAVLSPAESVLNQVPQAGKTATVFRILIVQSQFKILVKFKFWGIVHGKRKFVWHFNRIVCSLSSYLKSILCKLFFHSVVMLNLGRVSNTFHHQWQTRDHAQ